MFNTSLYKMKTKLEYDHGNITYQCFPQQLQA